MKDFWIFWLLFIRAVYLRRVRLEIWRDPWRDAWDCALGAGRATQFWRVFIVEDHGHDHRPELQDHPANKWIVGYIPRGLDVEKFDSAFVEGLYQ